MPRAVDPREWGDERWLTPRSDRGAALNVDVRRLGVHCFNAGLEGAEPADDYIDREFAFGAAERSEALYVAHFSFVREGLLRILGDGGRPLEARLLALMDVADRLSEYFDENSIDVDRRQLEADLRFVPQLHLASSWTDVMTERVARYYLEELSIDADTPLNRLVATIRNSYRRAVINSRLATLTEGEALAFHGHLSSADGRLTAASGSAAADGPSRAVGWCTRWEHDAMLRQYRRQRALLLLSDGQRIEQYLTNYCLNYVLVERYIDWPSLRCYAKELALRVASFRFLLFSHPGIRAAWDKSAELPESGEAEGELWANQVLERVVVETSQCVSRAADQSTLFSQLRRATGIDEAPGIAGVAALVTI